MINNNNGDLNYLTFFKIKDLLIYFMGFMNNIKSHNWNQYN